MADIKTHLNNIKGALYGKDVRGSIHDGIDAINTEVENTTGRQVDLENTFDQLVINAGNSNAEIVDARVKSDGTSYSKLGDRLNEVDSQLAHIKTRNKINIFDYNVKENDDITNILNELLSDNNICVDLKNGNFTLSGGVVLNENCCLENGNIIVRENGNILISNNNCIIKNISFTGDNSINEYCIRVIKSYNKLTNLKFKNLNTAIKLDTLNGGFYDVKMRNIDTRNVKTSIYISSYNGWLTDISVLDSFLEFTEYGIVLTRGEYSDINATSQLSHCNFDNITFLDKHSSANEGVGIYCNAGWNNFSNLNFFYDGAKSQPFYAIKFDDFISSKVDWDILQCARSNSFKNLFIEGYISKESFYLNSFDNIKFLNNNNNAYPLDKNNYQMCNTTCFSNISNKVKTLYSLNNDTYFTKMGNYTDIVFERKNDYIVVENNSDVDKKVHLILDLGDEIKKEFNKSNRKNIMAQFLIDDNSNEIVQNDYTVRLIEMDKATHLPVSYITDFGYNKGVLTTKGRIVNIVFLNLNKEKISNSNNSICANLYFNVKANSSVKIKDIRLYPYITTSLNESNIDWQNDYLL